MNIAEHYAAKLNVSIFVVGTNAKIFDEEPYLRGWNESVLGPVPSDDEIAAVVALPEPAPMPSVPETISDRQFFQQLAVQNVITQDEALAAVQTGAIPSEMAPLISELPADQRFAAKMKVSGATSFERSDQLVAEIGKAYGWDSSQLDAFWIAASAL